MDAQSLHNFENLKVILVEIGTCYEELVHTLKDERSFILQSQIENLNKNNEKKLNCLRQIQKVDLQRAQSALALARSLKLAPEEAKLLKFAERLPVDLSETCVEFHQHLSNLMNESDAINKQNSIFTQAALSTLNTALDDVKDSLAGKKTYAAKGQMKSGTTRSGNFVSKEA